VVQPGLGFGLQPGQRQQLLHEPSGAVAANQRGLQSVAPRGRVVHGECGLGLGTNAGDRRAQLVRGVGGEAPLGRQQRRRPLEQLVERTHQGQQFGRRIVHPDGIERGRIPAGEFLAEPVERHQAKPHSPPHAQPEQRQRHQQRQQRTAQHRLENLGARIAQLAHQHDDVGLGRTRREDAPVPPRQPRGVESGLQRRQRLGRRVPGMHVELTRPPDLERDPRRIPVQVVGRRQQHFPAVLQLQGHQQRSGLRQMAVEQIVPVHGVCPPTPAPQPAATAATPLPAPAAAAACAANCWRPGRSQRCEAAVGDRRRWPPGWTGRQRRIRPRAPCGCGASRACAASGGRALRWCCCQPPRPSRRGGSRAVRGSAPGPDAASARAAG